MIRAGEGVCCVHESFLLRTGEKGRLAVYRRGGVSGVSLLRLARNIFLQMPVGPPSTWRVI